MKGRDIFTPFETTDNGPWSAVYRLWSMVNGQWSMVNGLNYLWQFRDGFDLDQQGRVNQLG